MAKRVGKTDDQPFVKLFRELTYHWTPWEVFGEHDWTENDPDRGFQFEYFKDRRNRIKVDEDGDASWWWERSPYGSNSYNFCIVNSYGNANSIVASYTNGVCFGFYI